MIGLATWKLAAVGGLVLAVGGFAAGWRVHDAFVARAELKKRDAVIADLEKDAARNEQLAAELLLQRDQNDERFEKVRLEGGSCLVFDDRSLRLFNEALGHAELPGAAGGDAGGSGAGAAP